MVSNGVDFPQARSVGFATIRSVARAGLAPTAMAVMANRAMRLRIEASLDPGCEQDRTHRPARQRPQLRSSSSPYPQAIGGALLRGAGALSTRNPTVHRMVTPRVRRLR